MQRRKYTFCKFSLRLCTGYPKAGMLCEDEGFCFAKCIRLRIFLREGLENEHTCNCAYRGGCPCGSVSALRTLACEKWGIDPKAQTPAVKYNDGKDYVPTNGWTVFSHQFSSIAGAGPVTGAIQAAAFGWLPVLLWVLLGGVFSERSRTSALFTPRLKMTVNPWACLLKIHRQNRA